MSVCLSHKCASQQRHCSRRQICIFNSKKLLQQSPPPPPTTAISSTAAFGWIHHHFRWVFIVFFIITYHMGPLMLTIISIKCKLFAHTITSLWHQCKQQLVAAYCVVYTDTIAEQGGCSYLSTMRSEHQLSSFEMCIQVCCPEHVLYFLSLPICIYIIYVMCKIR